MNQADMNQQIRESLSAGIDGELSKEQLRFLLSRLGHDAPMQQTWQRYHLARDGVRGELPPMASAGFAARVMAAIEHDALPVTTTRRSHWLRWSAGGAIAASVAAAALMIAQPAGDVERMTASTTRQASAIASAPPAIRSVAPAAVPPWLSGNSAGLLSQQASATLGAPFGGNQAMYPRRLSAYPSMQRYRTLDNNDGSYLLLLDPRQGAPDTSRENAAAQ
ncbi:anti-anti-sigma factor [Rhodanobacter sp. T12-5]|nr:anti-anti-sigma factor [Rhodanobacter sp. T12-5]